MYEPLLFQRHQIYLLMYFEVLVAFTHRNWNFVRFFLGEKSYKIRTELNRNCDWNFDLCC